jgi:voltage-gated potassium channel
MLLSIGAQTFYKQSAETLFWLNIFDFAVCSVFIVDWLQRLRAAESKKKFLKWGWIDLALSIPATPAFWAANYPVLRALRTIRSLKYIYEFFAKDHKTSKFFDCCAVGIVFILVGAILVFNCEKHTEGANIKNLSDSLWWAMATVTTIGYGDRYPVSDLGRAMAAFVMLGGVGLYASFTAFIMSKLKLVDSDSRLDAIQHQLSEIQKKLQ